jgi:hypothetical protein
MTISLDTLKEAISIKEQIARLEGKLNQLLGGKTAAVSKAPAKKAARKMSAAARAKVSAAVKARWAKIKGASANTVAKAPAKKKGGLTPEGRAKLSAAMKARWAAKK